MATMSMAAALAPAVLLGSQAEASVTGGACNAFSGAVALGASYVDSGLTVPACGPRPGTGGGPNVYPYPGAPRATPGYQCVEFAERYLWYQYGKAAPNVYTNGNQVVDHYNTAYPGFFTVYSEGAGHVPVQGDVLSLFNSTAAGHTAVVESSSVDGSGNGSVTVIAENASATGKSTYLISGWKLTGWSNAKWLHRSVNPVAQYAGHIVQWNGDTKAQKTAWYVTPDLKRLWIPDAATYNCLKAHGAAGPDVLAAKTLNALPDQSGHWAPCGNQLAANRELRRGMSLSSPDGRFALVLQSSDGNFVLYGPSGALWASGKAADFVVMQSDGNLVGYTNGGAATWSTNTGGSPANRLVVQDDGNLVLYSASGAVWATGT